MVSLDEFSTKPVDTESRIDIVDIFISSESPILEKYINEEINESVNNYYKRNEILWLELK